VAVAIVESVDLDRAIAALETLTPSPARLEALPLAGGAVLLRDEFKSAEETIDSALDVLSEVPAVRRIVVLGEVSDPVGDVSEICRRLAMRVGRAATRVILIGGDDAVARWIHALQGVLPPASVIPAGVYVRTVTETLRGQLRPGDVVLIKGH